MSGKGSRPRPLSVDKKTFDDNWDNIFKKKMPWDHYSDLPSPEAYEFDQKVIMKNEYYDIEDNDDTK
jgi:hypothetical protein